jgi:hypothetical protein
MNLKEPALAVQPIKPPTVALLPLITTTVCLKGSCNYANKNRIAYYTRHTNHTVSILYLYSIYTFTAKDECFIYTFGAKDEYFIYGCAMSLKRMMNAFPFALLCGSADHATKIKAFA